jgi:hypothetical protein
LTRFNTGFRIADHPSYRGTIFVFDAVTGRGRTASTVFEFVHSLSAKYVAKSEAIVADGIQLFWLLDGSCFVSERRYGTRGNPEPGLGRLLKPKAFDLVQQLQGTALVHHNGYIWDHWKGNVWYPWEHRSARTIALQFNEVVIESEKNAHLVHVRDDFELL